MKLAAGPHGGDGARLAAALGLEVNEVLDLSLSLNPLAPDVGALAAGHVDALRRYPDDRAGRDALADAMGVDPDRLLLTNGGAEAIALVAQLQPVGWAEATDFSLYRRHLTTLDESGPRWMSDPANPTGTLAAPDQRAAVRDEAFYPLATGRWTRGDAATIVVGSLTKLFACPGLRLGYVLADPGTVTALAARRPEWSVNALGLALMPALLAGADLDGWSRGVAELRRELVALLASHGLVAAPSDANYVWIPEAGGLRDRLLPHAVLVRDGASFGSPRAVRIAVPDADGLERLATALRATEVTDR
jgi:histidinol-phosphate/aromatic aminotransferase/cobyric acid decarboxylase-like protein